MIGNHGVLFSNCGTRSLSQAIEMDGATVEDLIARRLVILDNIRDNDEAGINYQKVWGPMLKS